MAALYRAEGHVLLARRWRGRGGELDLVLRAPCGTTVFVEVKSARSHAEAAARVGARQQDRLRDAAAEYLALCAAGLDSPCRFDVALLDRGGRIARLENAF